LSEVLLDAGLVEREPGAPRGGVFVRLTEFGVARTQELARRRTLQEFKLLEPFIAPEDLAKLGEVVEKLKLSLLNHPVPLKVAG
jgi:DNA-binding MarR family transcriptional regulator